MKIRRANLDESEFRFASPQAASARGLHWSWLRGVGSGVADVSIVKTPCRREARAP